MTHSPFDGRPTGNRYSLMIHGGAGAFDDVTDQKTAVRYLDAVRRILEHGRDILSRGGNALEAVEACTSLLEDDPLFNAGCGSVLNEDGKVEMDAAIMDGRDLSAGAVAAISNIANPIRLARLVMDASHHVMLVGEGAMRFAGQCGMELMPDHYFFTPDRIEQLERAHLSRLVMLDHDALEEDSQNYGTVGAVARDGNGDLAAATSTGGIVNKRAGRVGDSPIIGAGVFAENATCAVSGTGIGEHFMRTVLAKTVSDLVRFRGLDAGQAAEAAIDYLVEAVDGRGGIIVIDADGHCAARFSTKRMIHGRIEHGGETVCSF